MGPLGGSLDQAGPDGVLLDVLHDRQYVLFALEYLALVTGAPEVAARAVLFVEGDGDSPVDLPHEFRKAGETLMVAFPQFGIPFSGSLAFTLQPFEPATRLLLVIGRPLHVDAQVIVVVHVCPGQNLHVVDFREGLDDPVRHALEGGFLEEEGPLRGAGHDMVVAFGFVRDDSFLRHTSYLEQSTCRFFVYGYEVRCLK